MKWLKITCLCLVLILSFLIYNRPLRDSQAFEYSLISVNNAFRLADYKLSEDSYNSVLEYFPDYVSTYNSVVDRDLEDLSTAKSMLISKNNYARRDNVIIEVDPAGNASASVGKTAYETSVKQLESGNDTDYATGVDISQSDMWVMAYKAALGTLESRPVTIEAGSNVYFYIAPNVYELYYKELLDKGVLSKSAFNNTLGASFLNEYTMMSSFNDYFPAWSPENGIVTSSNAEGSLGAGYSISYYSYDTGASTVSLNELDPNTASYFTEETLTTIEALGIIEDVMRITEKDMTETEANLVSYKYGVQYLEGLSNTEKATVEFLLAKGVLNFEDETEYRNLFGYADSGFIYKVLNRVANPDARLNFSEIQLTDAEAFWQAQGFGEEKIDVVDTDEVPDVETITSSELKAIESGEESVDVDGEVEDVEDNEFDSDTDTDSNDYFLDDIIGFITGKFKSSGVEQSYAATTKGNYTVIKKFDAKGSYSYKGTSITSLKKGDFNGEITKVSKTKVTQADGTGKVKVICVKFNVKAKDYASAVTYVDSNIVVTADTKSSVTVTGLTQIKGADGSKLTLIPASKLKESFSSVSIIEDKVLVNNDTGVQAVLLPEAGYALVGNKVIVSDKIIAFDSNNEVYYNLDVITSLVSNAYLKTLSNKTWIYHCSSMINEKLIKIESDTGTNIGKTYVAGFNVKTSGSNTLKKASMVSMDNITKGVSSLSRKFSVTNSSGKESYVYVIVDWTYAMPQIEDFEAITASSVTGKSATLNDINTALFTRPGTNSPQLQEWWDSNISISNSLCNFIYGTRDQVYVTSGFMAPSVTILKGSGVTNSIVASMFVKNNFALNSTGQKYADLTGNWYNSYFSGNKMSNEYLRTLANQYRKYYAYSSKATTGGSYFKQAYFVTTSGSIYKNVEYDDRLSINSTKTLLKCKTRTDSITSVANGTSFVYNGNTWIFCGNTSDGYFKILPDFDTGYFSDSPYVAAGTYNKKLVALLTEKSKTNNKITLGTSFYYNAMYKKLKKMYSNYFPGTSPPKNYTSPKDLYGLSKYSTFENPDTYYLYDNTVAKISDGVISKLPISDIASVGTAKCDAVPFVYLKSGNYSFKFDESTKSFKMIKGKSASVLTVGNIYYSGINQTVIDTIIAKDSGTIPLNDLEDGQKVYIADILYVCRVDSTGRKVFNSVPIKNSRVAAVCKKKDKKLTLSAIKGMFAGQKIKYSGREFGLTTYVTSAGVGPLTSQGKIKLGILYMGESGLMIRTAKKDSNNMSTSAEYLCTQLKFKDGLMVRPLDEEGTTYTLLYSGASAGAIALDNIAFLSESLSYELGGKQDLSLGSAYYKASQFYREVKADFKNMMSSAFRGDVVSLIWSIIFSISGYLAIMAWVCYAILTHGVGKKYIEIVTIPLKGVGRRGFDLIKLVTLGIYDIDSEPTLSRTIFTSFVCFFINYAILIWIAG